MTMRFDQDKLREITRRLVATYQPKRLIFFGSQVWGTPTEDSDLDILVEIDHTEEPTWKRARSGYKALFGLGIPCDILVRTSKEVARDQAIPVTLVHKIIADGQIVYE